MDILDYREHILTDLNAAEHMLDLDVPRAAYFVQQAFEKLIKYKLQIYYVRFSKTHDIEELLKIHDENIGHTFSAVLYAARNTITSWEAKTRYSQVNIERESVATCCSIVKANYETVIKNETEQLKTFMWGNLRQELKKYGIWGKAVTHVYKAIAEHEHLVADNELDTLPIVIDKLRDGYDITTIPKYAIQWDRAIQIPDGPVVYSIIAIRPFSDVSCNDYGGYIQSTANLDQYSDCWIQCGARCYGNARVAEQAILESHAVCRGDAIVDGTAIIPGNIIVQSDAHISKPMDFDKEIKIAYKGV